MPQKRRWTGTAEGSPACPPAGGCATRVSVNIDRVDEVCTIHPGPPPILYRGPADEAKRLRAFSKLYRTPLRGNV